MWGAVEFEGVTIRTHDNRRYRGTVVPQNPSTHVNREIADAKRTQDSMEVRLDAVTRSAADTRALGIEVGDFVFLDPRVEVTETGFIRSRHLDDKLSVACIFAALLALKDEQPAQDTYILISNYEEVGHGGSVGFPATLAELVTVDMAAIGDGQSSDEFSCTLCVKDSTGPYHFELNNKLRRIASEAGIALKIDIYPYYGSDGSAYWRAGGSARVALVGPGVDASHAYERTHKDSLVATANLLARYMLQE
jgi:putative aminopeptidase FrvX